MQRNFNKRKNDFKRSNSDFKKSKNDFKRPFKNNRNRNFKNSRSNFKKGGGIDPARFVNQATEPALVEVYQPEHRFADFKLNPATQATLNKIGFTDPSAIQDQAITPILEGKDVIGLASTGTGKTAAFLLPIIEKLSDKKDYNSVLILTPTRELAQQIHDEFKRFSIGQKLYSAVCVGGNPIGRQIRDINRGCQIIIATPGRLNDLIERKALKLDKVTTLVLDEADRMLDMGFINDITAIAKMLPKDRQTLCFSATITPTIEKLIQNLMNKPITISVRRDSDKVSDHIEQSIIKAGDKDKKMTILNELLNKKEFEKVLIFGETKFGVQRLADSLNKNNLPAIAIHGNKTQSQREKALRKFKTNEVKIMVATDVAARGLDIPNVSHVINFDQPRAYEDYVHRIGRTGRAGKTGKALTFVK